MKHYLAYLIFVILFQLASQKLTQLSYEFDPTMIQEDIDDLWTSQFGLKTVVTCHDSRKFGPHGGLNGVHLFKTYYLPPHWSLSISVELYMIWDWGGQQVTMRIGSDQIFQKTYVRDQFAQKHNCDGSGTSLDGFDLFIPYSMNITHSDTTMELHIEANMSSGITTRSLVISNLYVTVDSCYYTCETCSGPDYNQCLTCPTNAIFLVGECLCNPGYTMLDYQCQVNIVCPFDFVEFQSARTCVAKCLVPNCDECPDFQTMICTQCKTNYKLVDNRCIDKCPFWASDAGVSCLDSVFNDMVRPYTLALDFVNKDFSSADVQYSGWTYDSFNTQTVYNINNTPISSYAANKCNGLALAVGFAYLPQSNCAGGCSLTKTFNDLPQHFQIKIRFQLWAGGQWDGDTLELLVDGQSIDVHTYTFTNSNPNREFPCGNDDYIQNYIFDKNIPFIAHTAQTLTIEFKWTIADNLNLAWIGFRDLSILVDQCENSNCDTCSTSGQTCGTCKGDIGQVFSRISTADCRCPQGYENIVTEWNCQLIVCKGAQDQPYSRIPYSNCICPKSYFDDPNKDDCQECSFPCLTCDTSATNCLTCIEGENRLAAPSCRCEEGFFQNIRQVCEPCSEGCISCTSSEECTIKEVTSNFWIDYWYLIGVAVIILFFIIYFIYKVINYYDKKHKIQVVNINEVDHEEEEKQQKIKESREKAQAEVDKLRKKPKNQPGKGKTSWSFKNIPGTNQNNSQLDIGRDGSRKNTFADDLSIDGHLPNESSATNRKKRIPVDTPGKKKKTTIMNNSMMQSSGNISRDSSRQNSQRLLGNSQNQLEPPPKSRGEYRHKTGAGGMQSRSQFSKYNLN